MRVGLATPQVFEQIVHLRRKHLGHRAEVVDLGSPLAVSAPFRGVRPGDVAEPIADDVEPQRIVRFRLPRRRVDHVRDSVHPVGPHVEDAGDHRRGHRRRRREGLEVPRLVQRTSLRGEVQRERFERFERFTLRVAEESLQLTRDGVHRAWPDDRLGRRVGDADARGGLDHRRAPSIRGRCGRVVVFVRDGDLGRAASVAPLGYHRPSLPHRVDEGEVREHAPWVVRLGLVGARRRRGLRGRVRLGHRPRENRRELVHVRGAHRLWLRGRSSDVVPVVVCALPLYPMKSTHQVLLLQRLPRVSDPNRRSDRRLLLRPPSLPFRHGRRASGGRRARVIGH
mmetsp:Transcript_4063/g.16596  ORF Transcript_4063/g.16596 Transcript_4063/m.16596 type:complete len:339 (-) Transcript_4063:105-1121(-)